MDIKERKIASDIGKLKNIFQEDGIGIMATSDSKGWVNMAIYSPPIITNEGLLVFGATERLTYKNIKENPRAMFMFIRLNKGWEGVRIRLSLVKDEVSGPMLENLRERFKEMGYYHLASEICHALYFKAEEIRPLKG